MKIVDMDPDMSGMNEALCRVFISSSHFQMKEA
jgi:hypothetical protein